jgi:hypothetical protein
VTEIQTEYQSKWKQHAPSSSVSLSSNNTDLVYKWGGGGEKRISDADFFSRVLGQPHIWELVTWVCEVPPGLLLLATPIIDSYSVFVTF